MPVTKCVFREPDGLVAARAKPGLVLFPISDAIPFPRAFQLVTMWIFLRHRISPRPGESRHHRTAGGAMHQGPVVPETSRLNGKLMLKQSGRRRPVAAGRMG